MPCTVRYIVTAGHDAEHIAQSLISQGIGVMWFLPSLSNGGENFLSKQLMNWQPFVPGIDGIAYRHFTEHLSFGSPWRFLCAQAETVNDGFEAVRFCKSSNLTLNRSAFQITRALAGTC